MQAKTLENGLKSDSVLSLGLLSEKVITMIENEYRKESLSRSLKTERSYFSFNAKQKEHLIAGTWR